MIIGRLPFYQAWKKGAGTSLKRRRYQKIMGLLSLPETGKLRILEVGCANGRDTIQFLLEDDRFEVWGTDIVENTLPEGATFVQGDAAQLPFEDKSFDIVLSVGLLEHIEPMEKLCQVIKEMDRVGKHVISVMPSVSTLLEPHCAQFFYPLRYHRKMMNLEQESPLHLNFFTEHTWTKFEGFDGCKVKRFWYLPPIIRNTAVYK